MSGFCLRLTFHGNILVIGYTHGYNNYLFITCGSKHTTKYISITITFFVSLKVSGLCILCKLLKGGLIFLYTQTLVKSTLTRSGKSLDGCDILEAHHFNGSLNRFWICVKFALDWIYIFCRQAIMMSETRVSSQKSCSVYIDPQFPKTRNSRFAGETKELAEKLPNVRAILFIQSQCKLKIIPLAYITH